PHRPISVIEAKESLEYPLDNVPSILFVVEYLAARLVAELPGGRGLQQLYCQLSRESAPPIEVIIDLARPSASPKRWVELLRLRLETMRLDAPVDGICLRAIALGRLACRQETLFETESGESERQFADLLERLASRLGR